MLRQSNQLRPAGRPSPPVQGLPCPHDAFIVLQVDGKDNGSWPDPSGVPPEDERDKLIFSADLPDIQGRDPKGGHASDGSAPSVHHLLSGTPSPHWVSLNLIVRMEPHISSFPGSHELKEAHDP